MSADLQKESKESWIKANFASIVRACMAAIVVWTIIQIDPLGFGSASGAEARRTFQRIITSPFYVGVQKDITVVLIDDEYLKAVGHGWPLPYAYQGRLLQTVLDHHPKAVFVDLLYSQQHSDDDTPDKLLLPIRTRDTHIVLSALAKLPSGNQISTNCESSQAWSSDDAIDKDSIDKKLFNLRQIHSAAFPRLSVAYPNWYGCGDQYPLYLAGNPTFKTPAYALYSLFAPAQKHDDADFADPMVVMWGAVQSEQSAQMHAIEAGCDMVATKDPSRGKLAMAQALRTIAGIASSGQRGIKLPCLYTDVITASQLMQVTKHQTNAIDSLLKDRYVLVGSSISGIWDFAESPVNGSVPGVFVHAMALDNLLHYGSEYTRELDKWWELLLFLIVAIGLVAWHLMRKRCAERNVAAPTSDGPIKIVAILELAVWLGVALLLSYTGHAWAAVLCVIAGTGLDWMRERTAIPALLAGAACLLVYLFLWWRFHWAPYSWLALSVMILAVRKQLEKLDKTNQAGQQKFSVWHAVAQWYESSLKK